MITNDELKKLSKLSKIDIANDESEKFKEQINKIFDYIDKIKKYKFLSKKNIKENKDIQLRKDIVVNSDVKNLISEFSDKENNLLKVKKVL